MARLQEVLNVIVSRLHTEIPEAKIYADFAPPHLTEEDFPIIMYSVTGTSTTTGMGRGIGSIVASLSVDPFTLVDKGSAEHNRIEQKIFDALHQYVYTDVEDWRYVQSLCVLRGQVQRTAKHFLYASRNIYEIRGSEEV